MRLTILFLALVLFQDGNPFIEILSHYESQEITISLKIQNVESVKDNANEFELKSKSYFKIIPPTFEKKIISTSSFDPAKLTGEINTYYNLVDEQISTKTASYTWVIHQAGNTKRLIYKEIPSTFSTFQRLVLNNQKGCYGKSSETDNEKNNRATLAEKERRLRTHAKVKKAYEIMEREIIVCLSNGTIEEINKNEYNDIDENKNSF